MPDVGVPLRAGAPEGAYIAEAANGQNAPTLFGQEIAARAKNLWRGEGHHRQGLGQHGA